MDIFLLRHAETKSNQLGALSSTPSDPLTEHGLWQAYTIIDSLKALNIDTILCSPYERARYTVQPFAEAVSIPTVIHPCLAEGQLALDGEVALTKASYSMSPDGFCYPSDNEGVGSFLSRAKEAEELILSEASKRVLVVTHGHMIRELINRFLKLSAKTRFPHHNCGLSHLSIGEVTTVRFINRALCT